MEKNIFSIILNVGTVLVVAALAYGSYLNTTIAYSVGICVLIGIAVYAFRFLPAPKRRPRAEGAVASSQTKSPASSAAIVVAVVVGLLLLLPTIVLWLGSYSPELGAFVGAIGLMAMFLILWLRSRYQRSHEGDQS
ncbi:MULTISPECIES: hypothetical protein [unclassified Rhizobium]|uniref:hypothetical protein n=1 Tax=unclassified Rhizobium TaxID=2613769 RepID=UPI000A48A854|nr:MULTISPECIES: hypothetical protein [unclassified Rhizobium]